MINKSIKIRRKKSRVGVERYIKIHAEQTNLKVRSFNEQSPVMSHKCAKLQGRDLIPGQI